MNMAMRMSGLAIAGFIVLSGQGLGGFDSDCGALCGRHSSNSELVFSASNGFVARKGALLHEKGRLEVES